MAKVFMHSRCCNAHWELTYEHGKYQLECEQCGKEVPPGLVITGPLWEGEPECERCGEKRKKMS